MSVVLQWLQIANSLPLSCPSRDNDNFKWTVTSVSVLALQNNFTVTVTKRDTIHRPKSSIFVSLYLTFPLSKLFVSWCYTAWIDFIVILFSHQQLQVKVKQSLDFKRILICHAKARVESRGSVRVQSGAGECSLFKMFTACNGLLKEK